MKLKKKKGFTLIELLAVIVILTLIMLIATPLILKMIQTARKEAFRASAYGIMKSAEFKTERNILEGELGDFISKYENNVLSEGEKLDFKGTKPKQGIIVASNGKISLAITNGVWCARKGYNDTKITLKKYPEEDNCELEMEDVEWEIVDAEITVASDAVIKLRSSNNDIKYLVSNELRDFGPSYWKEDDVYEYPPVQFLDEKFLNQSDASNNKVSIIKYCFGFILTDDYLMDVYNENPAIVLENINIKDVSYDWYNDGLVVLFNDNKVNIYDEKSFEIIDEITNVKDIFFHGYLNLDNEIRMYDEDRTLIDKDVDNYIGEIWYEDYSSDWMGFGFLYMKGDQVILYTEEGDIIDVNGLSSNIEIFDSFEIKDNGNKFYELHLDENKEIILIENIFMDNEIPFNSNIKDLYYRYALANNGDIYIMTCWGYDENQVEISLEKLDINEKGIRFLHDLGVIELESGNFYDFEEEEYVDLSSMIFQFRNDAREILEEVIDIYSKNIYIDTDNKIKSYNETLEKFEVLDLDYNEIGKPYKILTSDWYYIDVINEDNNMYRIFINEDGSFDEYDVVEDFGVINAGKIVKVVDSFIGYEFGEFIFIDNNGKVYKAFFDNYEYEYYFETLNEDNNIFVVDCITPEIYADKDGYIYGCFYNYSVGKYEWSKQELDLEDGELYELDEGPSGNVISQFKEVLPLALRDYNDVLYIKLDGCWYDYSVENQFKNIGIKQIVAIDTNHSNRAWYIIVIDNNNNVWGLLQVASNYVF